MLAPSAYLASAAGTADLVRTILPVRLHQVDDIFKPAALLAWCAAVAPTVSVSINHSATVQRSWDEPCCEKIATDLLDSAVDDISRARIRASVSPISGVWLQALPIGARGWRLSNGAVREAVGLRLGTNICETHICQCGVRVDVNGIHGLACKRSGGRHSRYGLLNDVVW